MTVRLKDLVRLPDGTISTIADLADGGRVEFRKVTNFGDRGVTKYLAELKGSDGACWEIGELAFLSRTDRAKIQVKLA